MLARIPVELPSVSALARSVRAPAINKVAADATANPILRILYSSGGWGVLCDQFVAQPFTGKAYWPDQQLQAIERVPFTRQTPSPGNSPTERQRASSISLWVRWRHLRRFKQTKRCSSPPPPPMTICGIHSAPRVQQEAPRQLSRRDTRARAADHCMSAARRKRFSRRDTRARAARAAPGPRWTASRSGVPRADGSKSARRSPRNSRRFRPRGARARPRSWR